MKRNLAQRLLAGAAWALGAKVIGVGSALLVNALLARMLSPEDMGAYFLTVSIVMFAGILASFGLRQTVVRLVAESMAKGLPGRARESLRVVFKIAGLGAIVVGGGYYVTAGEWLALEIFKIPAVSTALGFTALWVAVLAFQTPVAETFRGLHDIRVAVFLDGILASAILATFVFLLSISGGSVDYRAAVQISMGAAAVSLLFGLILLWGRRKVFRGPGTVRPGEVVSISAPLFVTNVANYGINQFSLWIVAANLPAADVAIYGAAWRLVNLLALPIMLMNMTVNPVIAELSASDNKRSLQAALRGTATLAAVPAFMVLAAYMMFGHELLTLVFGQLYGGGALVLLILSMGMVVNVWTGSCGQVLALTGHQRALMLITVATGLFSVLLAVVSVRFWGLTGVAIAVATGRVLQNLSAWILVRKLTGLWTHGTLRPSFIRAAFGKVRGRTKSPSAKD